MPLGGREGTLICCANMVNLALSNEWMASCQCGKLKAILFRSARLHIVFDKQLTAVTFRIFLFCLGRTTSSFNFCLIFLFDYFSLSYITGKKVSIGPSANDTQILLNAVNSGSGNFIQINFSSHCIILICTRWRMRTRLVRLCSQRI